MGEEIYSEGVGGEGGAQLFQEDQIGLSQLIGMEEGIDDGAFDVIGGYFRSSLSGGRLHTIEIRHCDVLLLGTSPSERRGWRVMRVILILADLDYILTLLPFLTTSS